MKLTRFTHSCLLAETSDRVALFDPGVYSWSAIGESLDKIQHVDRVIITHNHPDHMSIDFIRALTKKFPESHVVSNSQVIESLKAAGIVTTFRGGTTHCSKPFDALHASTEPLGTTAQNTGYHFKGMLSHPGDSHDFNETKKILAMPFVSPWGITMNAIKLVYKLKPEIVLPIHDWHYTVEARENLYSKLAQQFSEQGIELVHLKHGESVVL